MIERARKGTLHQYLGMEVPTVVQNGKKKTIIHNIIDPSTIEGIDHQLKTVLQKMILSGGKTNKNKVEYTYIAGEEGEWVPKSKRVLVERR